MHKAVLISLLALSLFRQGTEGQLANGEKKNVLWLHNLYRLIVARGTVLDKNSNRLPRAGNMLKLEWNDTLEAQAQVWADGCSFGHDTDKPSENGENLSWGTIKALPTFVRMWYHEIWGEDYQGSVPAQFEWPGMYPIGHFTQLAWAKTKSVGCGLTSCDQGYFFVCRYYPAGNIVGAPIYLQSERYCSECKGKCWITLCKELPPDPEVADGGAERCGAALGTDCPEWFCQTGVPFGTCVVTTAEDGSETVDMTW